MFEAVLTKTMGIIDHVGMLAIERHLDWTSLGLARWAFHYFGKMPFYWVATVDFSVDLLDLEPMLDDGKVIQTWCFVSRLISLNRFFALSIAHLIDINLGLCSCTGRRHHLGFHFHVFFVLFTGQS